MTDTPTVFAAWSAVMNDVQSIEKGEFNKAQGFRFRGIDAVMDVVGPALRKHGVLVVPSGTDLSAETYQTSKGTPMRNVTVTMQYTVYGPGGDHFVGVSFGESADAGDKAVTKAQSVALRTFLLQSLMVPTGDPDPDASSHERAPDRRQRVADNPLITAKQDLLALLKDKGIAPVEATERFTAVHGGELKSTQDVAAVQEMIAHYRELAGG